MLPGEDKAQGQLSSSGTNSSFFAPSFVHGKSSKDEVPAPRVGVGKLGAVGLVCQENTPSNIWRCSCLLLSGWSGQGLGKDCNRRATRGRDSMNTGCFTAQVKGLLLLSCLSPVTPLCTTDYWTAPAACVWKSLCTEQCQRLNQAVPELTVAIPALGWCLQEPCTPREVSTVKKQIKQLDTRLHNKCLTDKLEKSYLSCKVSALIKKGQTRARSKQQSWEISVLLFFSSIAPLQYFVLSHTTASQTFSPLPLLSESPKYWDRFTFQWASPCL